MAGKRSVNGRGPGVFCPWAIYLSGLFGRRGDLSTAKPPVRCARLWLVCLRSLTTDVWTSFLLLLVTRHPRPATRRSPVPHL